ncbi:unnamed protein product [Medioppia subpectinata]|uniref:Anaphase-promoting complex subunit 4 n=1 Tax=Medioppia subpectinata TaxID=1979941 RepID=A0A7R9Q1I3_9ACAR|nr:unnamed protein product [Medioppia subpectinata]CAG2108339.1 unnamed protein product [Medioppia subpectinata]
MVSFRCLDDISGHISGEIDAMKWNPKMDLIVLSLRSGDVIVHRLVSWQKVWHLPKPKLKTAADDRKSADDKCFVRDMDWRPDGKILAIAYELDIDSSDANDGKSCLVLHDVETSKMIHKIVIDGQINCIDWQQKMTTDSDSFGHSESSFDLSKNCSAISPFITLLPKANSVSKGFMRGNRKTNEDNLNDMMKVENQKTLNVLAIGTENGFIELYAFGVYKIAKLFTANTNPIKYLALSSDLSIITAWIESRAEENQTTISQYSMISYNLNVLKQRSHQILMISQIYAQSISLLSHLNETMREIHEAWEDVMVEIDSKLSNYVSQHRSHSKSDQKDPNDNKIPLMADEFLELLVLGNASDSLEKFLNDLTDKGLKKLGHSIELAYSNIQKLVVKNVERVLQHIYCHFNALKGMALWEEKFGDVGLDVMSVNTTLKNIGSFLLKSTELQQVIDNSMRNVKAFIRWLYTAMVRLLNNESSQSELTKVSQQDIQFVTEFIKENFEFESSANTSRPSSSNFTLERVGQYLKEKDLTSIKSSINDISINPWIQYLNDRPNLTITDNKTLLLYEHKPNTSFVGEHKLLDQSVRQAFTGPFNVITQSLERNGLRSSLSNLVTIDSNELLKVNHVSDLNLGYFYTSLINKTKANKLFIIRHSIGTQCSVDFVSVSFQLNGTHLAVIDCQFYTETIISLLLAERESNQSFLVQMPLNLLNNNYERIISNIYLTNPMTVELSDVSPDSGLIYRSLDNMVLLSVSGSRKVACLSFASKRRVKLFEMDVCEDEEEEQDSTGIIDLNASAGQLPSDESTSFKDISTL